ncbi:MAG: hypothetical protein ACYTDY_00970 [Planctomycetota bacterium]|jgi:hypothetical protein
MRRLRLPAFGAPLEGIPAVHPWIAIAHGLGERLGRRCPYVLLLGASGEAFRIAYDREEPARAHETSPVNTFLAALAVSGLTGQVMQGGPFEPALGGVQASVEKGFAVVVGSRTGPAVVAAVDREAEDVEWVHARDEPRRISFGDLEKRWEAASWSSGPAPFLRVTVERGSAPRPLDEVARVGIETMAMLLSHDPPGTAAGGLAAWEAWAEDLRADAITPERAEILHGDVLTELGVGRLAASRFLESIARAIPPEERGPVEDASRLYREIHNPDPTGEVWGTGLLPEVAECLLSDGAPDPEKLGRPALRERAADLLLEIRDLESQALALTST